MAIMCASIKKLQSAASDRTLIQRGMSHFIYLFIYICAVYSCAVANRTLKDWSLLTTKLTRLSGLQPSIEAGSAFKS